MKRRAEVGGVRPLRGWSGRALRSLGKTEVTRDRLPKDDLEGEGSLEVTQGSRRGTEKALRVNSRGSLTPRAAGAGGATGTHRADLQRQGALQRLHLRHPRGMGRRGRTPASGPREARRRRAGRGRGGDEVAAAVAAVAPRPGPAVQPGSRPSSSCARGGDSLSWQPGGAGPEQAERGRAEATARGRTAGGGARGTPGGAGPQ